MTIVTLEEAKVYLRQDSNFEDALISTLIATASFKCCEIARLTASQWESIRTADATSSDLEINGETYTATELIHMKELLRVAVFYCIGYLYEHREEADHHDLDLTLRNLLCAIREGVF